VQAVLFDLDGTLLDIEIDSFLGRYFGELEHAAAQLSADGDGASMLAAIKHSTGAMMRPHPGATNRDVFYIDFMNRTGIDLADRWDVFEAFYEDVFPGLGKDYGPTRGAREAVEAALSLGLKVAVATNPIFPAAAVRHRIAWAGLEDLNFEVVTSYETMLACKPQPEYFRQTAEMTGVDPVHCLMVGDDRFLDMPAADTGMRTFYVGPDPAAAADYRGDLVDLAGLLPRLVAG